MFDIDKSKAINSMLFVLNQLGAEKSDAHKVFKILYFADQKHLVNYGRPITGDTYVKMQYGPVSCVVYLYACYYSGAQPEDERKICGPVAGCRCRHYCAGDIPRTAGRHYRICGFSAAG